MGFKTVFQNGPFWYHHWSKIEPKKKIFLIGLVYLTQQTVGTGRRYSNIINKILLGDTLSIRTVSCRVLVPHLGNDYAVHGSFHHHRSQCSHNCSFGRKILRHHHFNHLTYADGANFDSFIVFLI